MEKELNNWINAGDVRQRELLVGYARMFNRLDIEEFTPLLGDFVTYQSQSVREVMRGKQYVAKYLKVKIENLRRSGNGALVRADLGEAPGVGACVVMYQARSHVDRSSLDEPLAMMHIKPGIDGKVGEMLMVTVAPSPNSAKGTGLFPGLDDQPLQPFKSPLLHPVNDYNKLELVLCLLDGKMRLDLAMQGEMDKVLLQFPGVRYRSIIFNDASIKDSKEVEAASVHGFPSLIAYWNNVLVIKRTGFAKAENLISAIKNVVP